MPPKGFGNASFKKQDDQNASYANKIDKSEGKINWQDEAEKIIGKVNGLYPNSYFVYDGERYKILKAEISSNTGAPGNVLTDKFEIGCKKGAIKILEIQREGNVHKKLMNFHLVQR